MPSLWKQDGALIGARCDLPIGADTDYKVNLMTCPGFPIGGGASYTGETMAIQATTILTGTVRVDVAWNSLAGADNGVNTAGDAIAEGGTMSLTISDLAWAAGDRLTHGGSATATSEEPGNEIVDIVLGGFTIVVGDADDNANDPGIGAADTTDATRVIYSEVDQDVADASSGLCSSVLGMPDEADTPSTFGVKALFVGQGMDSRLGVIGTWTVQDAGTGRLNAAGTKPDYLGTTIYGAFGAEAPYARQDS